MCKNIKMNVGMKGNMSHCCWCVQSPLEKKDVYFIVLFYLSFLFESLNITKNTIYEIKILWMVLTAYETLGKKSLVNLNTSKHKLSK